MEQPDKDFIAGFKNLSTRDNTFNKIVDLYKERLYWHVRKILIDHDDADDVLQNTFIKAWKGLETFREDSSLFTWLYRIATNEALSFLRKKKRENHISWEDAEHSIDGSDGQEYFSGDEMQKLLQKAILSLPEKQRLVFNMKYYDEMKYEDMSEIMETSVGALKASYHHAVKKIKKFLEND